MIIKGGKIISLIAKKAPKQTYLLDVDGNYLQENSGKYLITNIPEKIAAIYKGGQLIWLTTYTVDIISCYGSGTWLDSYPWVDSDIWRD